MLKTIIFDNNGVLTTCDDDTTVPKFAEYFGVDVDFLRPIFHEVVKPADLGLITTEEFFYRLSAAIDKECNPEEIWPIFKTCYIPKPGMREFLACLKSDYTLALLTNFVDYFDELNEEHWHYEKIFDSGNVFVSSRIHLAKPDPKIYEFALEKLKTIPSEAVFIDDRESNLITAREIGMKTILFITPEQCKNELQLLLGANNAEK